jgi:hypothetical protein
MDIYIEIIVHTYEAMSYSIAPQEPEILQWNLRMLSTQFYQQSLSPKQIGVGGMKI